MAKDSKFEFTPRNATFFFLPLCIQAMSQAITYPLVGIVVSHGEGGVFAYSAFAQGLMIMFFINTIGYGLITTGMVFARDRIGYLRFARVNIQVMLIEAALQIFLALPVVAPFVFGTCLGLSGMQLEVARWSMLWSLPAQMAFLMRNIPQAVLYNEHRTALANTATILRILLTAAIAPVFYLIGLTGWQWGCVCLCGPVILECVLMWSFARESVARLPRRLPGEEKVTSARIFFFNIPLSMGGFLLMFSVFMLNAIINRTENGAAMLAVHMLAVGLINPLSYGALRNQAVAIGFPPKNARDNRTFRFALVCGIVLAAVVLIVQLPAISEWYFCGVQNLPKEALPLARNALLIACPFLFFQAIRGHAEGLAAYARRPKTVLLGQVAFLVVLIAVMSTLFLLGSPGCRMGITALACASAAAFLTIRLTLLRAARGDGVPRAM